MQPKNMIHKQAMQTTSKSRKVRSGSVMVLSLLCCHLTNPPFYRTIGPQAVTHAGTPLVFYTRSVPKCRLFSQFFSLTPSWYGGVSKSSTQGASLA